MQQLTNGSDLLVCVALGVDMVSPKYLDISVINISIIGGLCVSYSDSSIRGSFDFRRAVEPQYAPANPNILKTLTIDTGLSKHTLDFSPIDETCPCPTCRDGTSRAMLHHISTHETAAAHGT